VLWRGNVVLVVVVLAGPLLGPLSTRMEKISPLTFCLSRIFMAKKPFFSLCWASITRPKEPVPSVFTRSKSSKAAVFCSETA